MLITVAVTADDLERGRSLLCCHCPVALALERQTGVRWVVHADCCRPLITQGRYRPLPTNAQDLIRSFDSGDETWPIEFLFDTDEPEPEPVVVLAV